jgi:hypothetical protein
MRFACLAVVLLVCSCRASPSTHAAEVVGDTVTISRAASFVATFHLEEVSGYKGVYTAISLAVMLTQQG